MCFPSFWDDWAEMAGAVGRKGEFGVDGTNRSSCAELTDRLIFMRIRTVCHQTLGTSRSFLRHATFMCVGTNRILSYCVVVNGRANV